MKLNINSVNKTWRTVGLVVLAAGALTYPAIRLYKYIAQKRRNAANEPVEETETHKAFSPSYRGNHKPHRRKAEANGHFNKGELA